jgi:hypothetical protein
MPTSGWSAGDDGDRRPGPLVALEEIAPEGGRHAEERQVRRRHHTGADELGGSRVTVGERAVGVGRGLRELRLLLAQREIVGDREPESEGRRIGIDSDQPIRLVIRQRSQQRRVHRREDRGRRADAKADRQDNRQRQHGRPPQAAGTDADVLREVL